jgi:putative hydrolase of the HAD superfamily
MVKHLLLDLDGTLYPGSARIIAENTRRMICFIAELLDISFEEAKDLRTNRNPQFGTTLEWLQAEHGFGGPDKKDKEEKAWQYMRYVHPEEEVNEVPFDPHIRPFLRSLHLPMTVLTNAPAFHAERILRFLQINDLFLGIWDVVRSNFKGKPHWNAYVGALSLSGYTIEETLFADDYPQYVQGYLDSGGRAVLVNDQKSEWEKVPSAPHIDSLYEIGKFL